MADSASDPSLDAIIARYLQAVEAGKPPDRQALLAAHPSLAREIEAFLDDHARMQHMAEPLTLPLAHPPEAGDRIRYFGDYELRTEIARGGMGVIYQARQITLDRVVAVKMLLAGPHASADETKRFRAEAEAAARLDHPAIVPIYEVGEHDGRQYLAMRYIEGVDLARRMRDHPLPPKEAARHVADVAAAIHHAHGRGVLHRDLKPSNVIVDVQGKVHVTDFGLAKRVDVDRDLTTTGEVLGTPCYMPPEQAAGSKDVSVRSDVYSLGAILYALVTGRPPFQAETTLGTLRQVLEPHVEPAAPRTLNPAVPRDLETIVVKSLRKDPRARYASAAALAEDLERFLRDEPILARPAGVAERLLRWCRRRPATAALFGAVGLLLVAVVALLGITTYVSMRSLAAKESARAREESDRRRAEMHLHAERVNLAQAALEEGDLTRAYELLEACTPRVAGADDWREWAWGYLWNKGQDRQEVVQSALPSPPATGPVARVVAIGVDGDGTLMAAYPSVIELHGPGGESRGRFELPIHEELVDAAISRDGRWVAAASGSGLVLVWNARSGEVHLGLQLETSSSVALGSDGSALAIGRYLGVDVRDVVTGRPIVSMAANGAADALQFSPDGSTLAGIGSESGELSVWSLRDGSVVLQRHPAPREVPARTLAFSPDGSSLALGSGDPTGYSEGELRIMAIAGDRGDTVVPLPWGPASDVAWTAEGDVLAAIGGGRGQVVRVAPAPGKIVERRLGHFGGVTAVVEGCGGLYSGGRDGTVRHYLPAARPERTQAVTVRYLPGGDAFVLRPARDGLEVERWGSCSKCSRRPADRSAAGSRGSTRQHLARRPVWCSDCALLTDSRAAHKGLEPCDRCLNWPAGCFPALETEMQGGRRRALSMDLAVRRSTGIASTSVTWRRQLPRALRPREAREGPRVPLERGARDRRGGRPPRLRWRAREDHSRDRGDGRRDRPAGALARRAPHRGGGRPHRDPRQRDPRGLDAAPGTWGCCPARRVPARRQDPRDVGRRPRGSRVGSRLGARAPPFRLRQADEPRVQSRLARAPGRGAVGRRMPRIDLEIRRPSSREGPDRPSRSSLTSGGGRAP
ncbi:MAG: protein kinase [Acidobacteriota bacterium]